MKISGRKKKYALITIGALRFRVPPEISMLTLKAQPGT
jgi:hypothetical protein